LWQPAFVVLFASFDLPRSPYRPFTMHPRSCAWLFCLTALLCVFSPSAVLSAAPYSTNANRLAYLDEDNPFYPHRDFPKLITPQWVGEPGVEAVVILAIDDMRDSKKYETYLRPILDRLKRMDGRAPVSIFANVVEPADPQLQTWLKEGLSLEVHTLTHPCPLLQKGSFTNAWNTYHGGVDLLSKVPGNKPVAFRMPCCDSMNSPSPRFYAEILNRTSPDGHFLQADSSVMCLLTDEFRMANGERRIAGTNAPGSKDSPLEIRPSTFRKYFPATTNVLTKKSLANFGTYIEDYPYPYVINRTCWEFPAMVPSDWEAFNAHGPTNAATVADWQLALDAVVRAQGVFTFIFHPHGWIRADQIIQFIDHAERTHGKKVKFLTFKEAVERLNKNVLNGNALRHEVVRPEIQEAVSSLKRLSPNSVALGERGSSSGIALIDANNDGFMDVLLPSDTHIITRLWQPLDRSWKETNLNFDSERALSPLLGVSLSFGYFSSRTNLGVLLVPKPTSFIAPRWSVRNSQLMPATLWELSGDNWRFVSRVTRGGTVARDFDRDGFTELASGGEFLVWSNEAKNWKPAAYSLPKGVGWYQEPRVEGEQIIADPTGLRFVDLNGDGFDDLFLSNEREYAIYLWARDVKPHLGWHAGWSHKVLHEQRGAPVSDPARTNEPNKRAGSESGAPKAVASTNHSSLITPHSKEIPPFVRSSPHRNNGAWFHRNQLFVQNEDTAHLPDVVWRKSFSELIAFDMPAPKTPAESQLCFQVRPGFRVELVAAEPLVMSPVAFEWGADGRLWVVEMTDYPNGVPRAGGFQPPSVAPDAKERRLEAAGTGGGRVKFLEDLDGDGRYDRATVFLDSLPFPTGVMPWRKGVLISAAPDILYAEDTDGDGKADVRQVLFTGFREGNQQHRVNGFELGLDNWIYGANGDSGGTVRWSGVMEHWSNGAWVPQPNTPPLHHSNSPPVSISGRDFRFRPDTGEFEAIEGQTQFGRRRDDWGNWFGNNNPNWLWHYWLPDRYLRRNPHLAVKSSRQMLANYPDSTRCFPISTPPIRFNQPQSVNHVTSGCSPAPYRDDLFGPGFATSVFISEPVHNLVHREVLVPDGVSFTSRRAPDEQDREFLASTDNWFRPTMLKTGPDGALYVADFYRFVLEHPEWIAPETQARLDLRAGSDKGRLWRVVPVDQPRRPVPNLAKLNTTQLVAALDSPSGWQRDTVQRLLVERKDVGAVKPLEALVKSARNPKGRLQALCVLEGMNSLSPPAVSTALGDKHDGVVEHVFRFLEPMMPKLTNEATLGAGWKSLEERYDRGKLPLRLRYFMALSAGQWSHWDKRVTANSLASLAYHDSLDSRFQTAILSSISGCAGETFRSATHSDHSLPPQWLAEAVVRQTLAEKDSRGLQTVLDYFDKGYEPSPAAWKQGVIATLLDGLSQRGKTLAQFAAESEPGLRAAIEKQASLFATARTTALSQSAIGNRQSAIALLGRGPSGRTEDLATLATLLKPQQPAEIQTAAVAQLAKLGGPDSASALLADWKAHSPALREAVLSALLSRPAWIDTLLAALERGQVAPTQISPAQRQKLTTHPQAALRDRATKLFAATSADRAKVIKDYAVVATLTGSETRGRELFTKNCGVCHKLKGEGREIGPDLAMTTTRDTDWLLTAILDPNAAVEARYLGYTAETKSGREFTGLITAETPNNLVMRGADGTEETILRTDLKQLLGSGLSLMPEGMESALKPQDMADLLAFIRAK
jgi:putative membrane-bound dehydrogenase-like protein